MIINKYVIADKKGLHAYNATRLCREASEFKSSIVLKSARSAADCKNVLSLMSLGAKQGEVLELCVDGEDEAQAAVYIQNLMRMVL